MDVKLSNFWMPLESEQPDHFNTGPMSAILFSYVLVWYLNGWSSTWDKANWLTIWRPNTKKLVYSNVSSILLVGILIPLYLFCSCPQSVETVLTLCCWFFFAKACLFPFNSQFYFGLLKPPAFHCKASKNHVTSFSSISYNSNVRLISKIELE